MKRYEFALLRYLHDLSSGEFANIGVVLYQPESRFLSVRVSDRYRRVSEFFGGLNGASYKALVRQFERSLRKVDRYLEQPDLLSAHPRSLGDLLLQAIPDDESSLRTSDVMFGVADDPEARLVELFEEFVGRYDNREERPRRQESDVRNDIEGRIIKARLTDKVQFEYPIHAANYDYNFQFGWQNGKPQVLEPISLDLVEPLSIVEKATKWTGRLYNLSRGADFGFNALLARPQESSLVRAVNQAVAILRNAPTVRTVVFEEDSEALIEQIRQDTGLT